MSVWNRIFGTRNKSPVPAPSGFTAYTNEDAGERLSWVPDQSASAIAARHNFAAIYGANNMPPNFGLRPVIEVRDGTGAWVPVSGNTRAVPDLETQEAYLASYRESGIIGPQAVGEGGSMGLPSPAGLTGPAPTEQSGSTTGAGASGAMLSFGPDTPAADIRGTSGITLSFGQQGGEGQGEDRTAPVLTFGAGIDQAQAPGSGVVLSFGDQDATAGDMLGRNSLLLNMGSGGSPAPATPQGSGQGRRAQTPSGPASAAGMPDNKRSMIGAQGGGGGGRMNITQPQNPLLLF